MTRKTSTRRWVGLSLVGILFGASACSATRPPTEAVAQAELAVREANSSKAPEYAPLELGHAQQKLQKAKEAIINEKHENARIWAEQALVDAQLAEAKADSDAARQNAQELRKTIEALQTEAARPSVPAIP